MKRCGAADLHVRCALFGAHICTGQADITSQYMLCTSYAGTELRA